MGIVLYGKGGKNKPKTTGILSKVTDKVKQVADKVVNTVKAAIYTPTAASQVIEKAGYPDVYAQSLVNLSAPISKIISRGPTIEAISSAPYALGVKKDTGGGVIEKVRSLISENPLTSVAIATVGGGLIGGALGFAAGKKKSPAKKKKKKSTTSTKRKKKSSSKRKGKKHFGTAKQYARKGGKAVKYTKNGQPYIILNDGRARFIKGKRR